MNSNKITHCRICKGTSFLPLLSLGNQSFTGIFPKDESLTYYLLGFLNSPTCNLLIRTINSTANNPANYIKKIPFIQPSKEQREQAENIVLDILKCIKSGSSNIENLENQLNNIFKEIYGF